MTLLTVYIQNKLDNPIKFQVNSSDLLEKLYYAYKGILSGLLFYDIFIPYYSNTFSECCIPNGAVFHYVSDEKSIVFLCLNNGKKTYIPIEFNPKTLVRDFKTMLHDEYQIQIGQQKLFYHYQELQDDHELMDYMITTDSIIYLAPILENRTSNTSKNASEKIQVKVKIINISEYQIEANTSEKIIDFKKKIIGKTKFTKRIEVITLMFNSDELDDDKTLQDYSITNNSILLLKMKNIYKRLTFSLPRNRTIKFKMIDTDKIVDVKSKIQRKTGITYIDPKLFCNGIELDDIMQIQNYPEIEMYRIDLKCPRNGGKIIFIKRNEQHIIPVELKPNSKIIDIKKELPYPLDESIIKFNDKELENDEEVAYNPDFSDRNKCMRISMRHEIVILVQLLTCEYKKFEISPYDFIIDIKYLIDAKEGVPFNEQRIIFNGKQLENYEKVQDCKIENFGTLRLWLRLRGG